MGAPQASGDLLQHNCLDLGFRSSEPGWPFRDGEKEYLLAVKGNLTANNGETLVRPTRDGHSITRVDNFYIQQGLAFGQLVTSLDEYN